MKTLFALLWLLLPVLRAEPPAKPALGMTPAELAVKYGESGQADAAMRIPPAESALRFRKNGVSILVQLWNGRAVFVSYERAEEFTVAEREALLAGNAAGWKPAGRDSTASLWESPGLVALYLADRNTLVVQTNAFYESAKVASAGRVKGL